MQCDICGQEVDNSEALVKHKEEMHAMGEQEEKAEELESPEVPAPDEPDPEVAQRLSR